jgi:transcriptional regulator with XRE-family HTH domain
VPILYNFILIIYNHTMQNVILRTLRVAKNLTQDALGNMLDMSQANYSDLENGKTKISTDIALKLADIFDVSPEIFITDKQFVYNHNIGTNSKSIHNFEHYHESEKETIQILLQKVDSLYLQLQQERDEVNKERKQVLELMGKLVERLG